MRHMKVWYEGLALMSDYTSHHHQILAASEEDMEQRMSGHYPNAAVILVIRKAE